MSTVKKTAKKGADTFTVTDYFGGCPECGRTTYLNVGRNQFITCDEHKVGDYIGGNMLSSWREENEEIWERNRKLLNTYTKVEFLPEGTWSRDPETRKVELEKYERKLAKRAYTPLKAEFAEDCEAPF